jgi:hypothetical protein
MSDHVKRTIELIFVRDLKQFVELFSKKQKCDYLLNVTKIIKDKFGYDIVIPNKIQTFLITYEIKKLLDKAVNVRNKKYTRIIYVNSNLNLTVIKNTIDFLTIAYPNIEFILNRTTLEQ